MTAPLAVVVIATGRYGRFVRPLWAGWREHYAGPSRLVLFTDDPTLADLPEVVVVPTPHEPWPGPTLHRYRTFTAAADLLREFGHILYLDADMAVVGPLTPAEVCPPTGLLATVHPGYHLAGPLGLPHCHQPRSRAYVRPGSAASYYCGGVQGGNATAYLAAAEHLAGAIADDESRGVTATWHDESHWNRYLLNHPPERVLSPAFCVPEGHEVRLAGYGRPRVVALNKDHRALRALR